MPSGASFTLSPIDAGHVLACARPRDIEEVQATSPSDDLHSWGRQVANAPGLAFTVRARDGEAVAVGGWRNIWDGVVNSWMIATPRIAEVGATVHRMVRRGETYLVNQGVRRFHVHALSGHDASARWLVALGYGIEGEHPGFGRRGETFVTWAKLAKGAI